MLSKVISIAEIPQNKYSTNQATQIADVVFTDNNIGIAFSDNPKTVTIRLSDPKLFKTTQLKATAARIQYAIDIVSNHLVKPKLLYEIFEGPITMVSLSNARYICLLKRSFGISHHEENPS